MARIEHVFVAGVRFDTEIQYIAQAVSGLQYYKLPVVQSLSPLTCTFNALFQGVLIAGRLPYSQVDPERQALAKSLLAKSTDLDALGVLGSVRMLGSELDLRLVAMERRGTTTRARTVKDLPGMQDTHLLGDRVLELLRTGGLGYWISNQRNQPAGLRLWEQKWRSMMTARSYEPCSCWTLGPRSHGPVRTMFVCSSCLAVESRRSQLWNSH